MVTSNNMWGGSFVVLGHIGGNTTSIMSQAWYSSLFGGAPPTSTSTGGLVYLGATLFPVPFLTQGILLMSILLHRVVLFPYLGTTPSASMLLGVLCSLAVLTMGGNLHLPVTLSRISPMTGRILFFTSRCIFPLLIWGGPHGWLGASPSYDPFS